MASRARLDGGPALRQRAAHLGPERRRPLVLDATLELLAEGGLEAASMNAIAQRTGVSKPVLYDCFESKEALFGALIDREERRLTELVKRAIPTPDPGGDLESGVRVRLTSVLEEVARDPTPFRVIYLTSFGNDTAISERVARARKEQRELLASMATARLVHEGADDAERRGQYAGALLVETAELAVRLLLETPPRWTATELGELAARVYARGGMTLATR